MHMFYQTQHSETSIKVSEKNLDDTQTVEV